MGKKGNKRKKSVDSVDGCSEASDTSTDQGPGANTSMISKVLSLNIFYFHSKKWDWATS